VEMAPARARGGRAPPENSERLRKVGWGGRSSAGVLEPEFLDAGLEGSGREAEDVRSASDQDPRTKRALLGGLPPPASFGFERRGTRCGRALPAPTCGHRFVLAGGVAPRPAISPPPDAPGLFARSTGDACSLVCRRSAINAVRTVPPGQKSSAGERNVCGVWSRFAADPPGGGSSLVRTAPVFRPTTCSVACGAERRQKPPPARVACRTPRPEGNGRTALVVSPSPMAPGAGPSRFRHPSPGCSGSRRGSAPLGLSQGRWGSARDTAARRDWMGPGPRRRAAWCARPARSTNRGARAARRTRRGSSCQDCPYWPRCWGSGPRGERPLRPRHRSRARTTR
jgi:hypothetical protein